MWYFTFGSDHKTRTGRSLGRNFAKIGGTFEEARDLMMEVRGARFAFQYKSEAAAGVRRWDLKEISLSEIGYSSKTEFDRDMMSRKQLIGAVNLVNSFVIEGVADIPPRLDADGLMRWTMEVEEKVF